MRNEIAIFDPHGVPLSAGATGEVAVRGPSVIREYFRNPAATERAIRNGWFHTGDVGYLDGDGYLFLSGRESEFINRGGEKVAPEEIDAVLMAHPAVAEAVAFPIADDELGEEIGAAVRFRKGAYASVAGLQEFAANHLSSFKVPRRIFLLDSIPSGATGKTKRSALAGALIATQSENAATADVPNEYEPILARIFCEALGLSKVGRHDNFFDLGGTSLTAATCAAAIAKAFSVKVPPAVFIWAPTVALLANVLSNPSAVNPARVFPVEHGRQGLPLFVVGPGMEMLPLARNLGRHHPVAAIAIPDLQSRPTGYSLEQIAAECVAALRKYQPQGPYALAGWCGAGVLALEIANQLDSESEVAFVAILDARDIYLPDASLPKYWIVKAARQKQRLQSLISRTRSHGWTTVLTAIRARTAASDPHSLALDLALHQYRPRPWNGRVVHIWSAEKPKGQFSSVEFQWGEVSPGGFDYYEVPGDHLTMLHQPRVAEILTAELDRVSHYASI